jgi:hypothetical protein
MVKVLRSSGLAFMFAFAAACGGDPDPGEACNQLVDAYSNAWVRCKGVTYDSAKQTWSKAFSSCAPSNVNQGQVDQCSSQLQTADCNLIKNGGNPSGCTGVLSH